MAGNRGVFTVRVVSDTKPAEQGLDRFASKVQTTGEKVESTGRKMTVFATVPVAAAMGAATKAASDLQQAVGGTEAVFGEAGREIDRFAKTAASASGLSEREFREATTGIGGQLKRMTGDVDLAAEQSIELTRVAADLAATYGGTTAEAVDALGSAFRGEADPAERFNLNLKAGAVNAKAVELGLAASTSEVDENAKAQATLALIMEQSADAQGQFARESGSAAGSMQIARAEMENAAAELGTALLPIVSKVAGGVADLAQAFGSLPEPVQNGVIAFAGLLAVSGPLLTVGGRVMTVWSKAGPLFDKAAVGAFNLSGNLGGLAKNAGALAVAGIAVERAINAFRSEMDEASSDAEAFVETFTEGSTEPVRTMEALQDEIMRVGAAAAEMKRRGDEALNPFLKERYRDAEAGLNATRDALLEQEAAAAELQRELGITADEAARLATDEESLARIVDPATGKIDEQKAAAEEAAEAHKQLEENIKGVQDALRSSLDPLFATRDALNDHKEAQDDLKVANLEYLAASQDLDIAIEEHGRKSDEAAAAWVRQVDALQRVQEAEGDVVESALDVSVATADLTAKMQAGEVSIADAEAQLRTWVDQGLITEDQAYKTSQELRGVASAADEIDGRDVAMNVRLANFAEVVAQLDELARRTGTPLLSNASVAARDRATPGATAVTQNITVNYPKPEPAGEAIHRAARKAQYAVGGGGGVPR